MGDSEAGLSQSRLQITCEACRAQLQVERAQRTVTCPYCDSHSIIERPASEGPRPAFVLAFKVNEKSAAKIVKQWISSRGFFTRSDFKRATVSGTRGVYAPAYLYGAVARSTYSAQIGEQYTVVVTTGKSIRRETRTEWCNLQGSHACYIDDVIVTASRGIPNESLEAIEPFNLGELRRYTPELISGWASEEPTRGRDECFELAHGEAVQKAGAILNRHMPGDEHRNLRHDTRLFEETVDLVLLPVWSFAARYHAEKPPVQILVNGQTGAVHGDVPRSVLKIVLVILGALIALGGLAFAAYVLLELGQ